MVIARFCSLAVAGLVVLVAVAHANRVCAQEATPSPAPVVTASPAAEGTDNRWHFRITPYIWLPTINARFHFVAPSVPAGSLVEHSADVQLGPNKYLSHLNSAVQISVEADKGPSFVFADLVYVNVGNTGASVVDISGPNGHISFPINLATSARLTSTEATGGIGNELLHEGNSEASAFVGLRYLSLTANASWTLSGPLNMFSRTGSATGKKSDLLGLVGARGRVGLGTAWFVPLYVDYGGSGALTTYQWYAGIAHQYHSGAQSLVWRQIAYFSNNDPSGLIQDVHEGGPAFAWSFYL